MVFPHHIFTNIPLLVYLYLIYSEKKFFKLPQTMLYLFDIVNPKTKKLTEKMPQTMPYWKRIKVTHESWWHIGKYWMFAVYHLSLKIMITLLTFLYWNQAWRGLLIQSNYWHYSFKRAFHKKNHQTNRLIQDLCI